MAKWKQKNLRGTEITYTEVTGVRYGRNFGICRQPPPEFRRRGSITLQLWQIDHILSGYQLAGGLVREKAVQLVRELVKEEGKLALWGKDPDKLSTGDKRAVRVSFYKAKERAFAYEKTGKSLDEILGPDEGFILATLNAHEFKKLRDLIKMAGFERTDEFLQYYVLEERVPGICMHVGCYYWEDVEPAADQNWCPECEDNCIRSGLHLAGIEM